MPNDHGNIADHCQAKKYLKKICFIQPTYPTFFGIWNLNHIFFVMFKIDQKNANQLEILKFDWNFFQLHFDSRRLLYW